MPYMKNARKTIALSAILAAAGFLAQAVEVHSEAELSSALRSASAFAPTEIYVASGTYEISSPLRIWSGTTLTLADDATIVYTGGGDEPILRGSHFDEYGYACYETSPGSCWHGGYGQCHDVVVQGGTWNRNSKKTDNTNIFIFRHASDITIRNMVVKNCSNHYFNLSGSRNVTISNVKFQSPVKYTGSNPDFWGKFAVGDNDRYKTIEAIHLDAITKGGEPSGYPIDGTPCKNVKVINCDFKDVFSGVGTHHVSEGEYGENIRVENCRFSNLQSFAIYCFGYKKAVFSGNVSTGGAGLITVEDANCTICGNNKVSDGFHNAIQIGGGAVATIDANKISNAGMAAIRLLGAATATVTDNTIDAPATMGLSAAEGSSLTASGNAITSAGQHGVYVNAAKATLKGNTIITPSEAGIRGDAKAKITAENNIISSAGTYGITLSGGSSITAKGNTISSPANYGIILDSCAASSITGNKITSSGSVGIRLNKTKGSTISKNTINGTSAMCDGILLDTCATGTVSGNKVSGTGGFGIRILGTAATPASITVSGNTVSTGALASGYHDIRLGDNCRKCKVSGNYLGNAKYSVSSTGTSGNKYEPPATSLVSLVRKSNAAMSAKWKKQTYAAGYQIQWADNKNFKKAKTLTVSKMSTASKSISGLAKKKRYWLRIRTFDNLSGSVCFSPWSKAMAALPAWAMGTFSGYAVVKGNPGLATMSIENTGAVSGTLSIGGKASSFSASDLASWNGKAFTLKFSVKVGGKTFKPTFSIVQGGVAQTIGVAKIAVKNFKSEMPQSIPLVSKSGKLAKLVGKSFAFNSATANSGLSGSNAITIVFSQDDVAAWQGLVNGRSVSGTSPCTMGSAVKKGTSVVYSAKIPICIPSIGYNRLVVCKVTRKKSGACSVKWSLNAF